VYAAVNAFANRVSSTELRLYRERADGEDEEVKRHPALRLLENPNPFLTRTRLLWHLVSDLKLSGNAYWFLAGPPNGAPLELWRMNPRRTRVVLSKESYIAGYVTEIDGLVIPVDANECIHFRQPNPFDDHDLYGLPTLAAAALAATTGRRMAEWNRSMFEQERAVPAGVVNITDWVDDDTFSAIKKDWRDSYGGTNRRTAFIRGGKAQFQAIGLSQTDVDWLAGSKWETEKVYRAFGTYHLLPAENTDDRKVNERIFLEENAWPLLVELAEVITDQLLTFYGTSEGEGRLLARFDDIRPRERALELEEQRERAKGLTVNEWRKERGLPPLGGGDDLMFVHMVAGEMLEFEQNYQPEPKPASQTGMETESHSSEGRDDAARLEDAQERAELRESAGDDVGDGISESTDKAIGPETIERELVRWQKYALARLGQDGVRPFQPEVIPAFLADVLHRSLTSTDAITAEGVRSIFRQARALVKSGFSLTTDVPDPVLHELVNWKISGNGFAPVTIPVDTAAYVRLCLKTVIADRDDVFKLAQAHYNRHYTDSGFDGRAAKDYGETAALYRAALYDLVSRATDLDRTTLEPALSRQEFGDLGRAEISTAFRAAFFDGLDAGGVAADELDEDEEDALKLEIKAERSYWTAFANHIYREVMPLYREAVQMQDRANEERDPDTRYEMQREALEKYREFVAAREECLRRIDLWVNKGLRRIFELGKLSAQSNQMMEWVVGPTEHCTTCADANGQRHRAKDWMRAGIMPQSDSLECGGFRCQCSLAPTKEKAKGRLDRITTAKAHIHDGELAAAETEVI